MEVDYNLITDYILDRINEETRVVQNKSPMENLGRLWAESQGHRAYFLEQLIEEIKTKYGISLLHVQNLLERLEKTEGIIQIKHNEIILTVKGTELINMHGTYSKYKSKLNNMNLSNSNPLQGWRSPTAIIPSLALLVSLIFNVTQCTNAKDSISLEERKFLVDSVVKMASIEKTTALNNYKEEFNRKVQSKIDEVNQRISDRILRLNELKELGLQKIMRGQSANEETNETLNVRADTASLKYIITQLNELKE